jgi:inner membrane protein
MDPLSHALLGAASGLSLSRRCTRVAALAGAAGAVLPDADVVIRSASDPLLNVEYHRHFSHALIVAPAGAAIAAGALWLVLRRRAAFNALYWPALAGYVSAILLDACTSYGTRLFWPLADTRAALSVVAVVDPVPTLMLLVGVALALQRDLARPARIAVAGLLVYLGLGALQQERARDTIMRLASARGHAVAQHEVKPTLGNLLLWRSVYLTENRFVVDAVRAGVWSTRAVYEGGSVPRLRPADLTSTLPAGSVQAIDVTRFWTLSEGYMVRHPEQPQMLGDVRYAMLPDSVRPIWGIVIDPSRLERHADFVTRRSFTPEDRRRFLAMLRGDAPRTLR